MGKKSKVLKFLDNKSENTKQSYYTPIRWYEEFHGTSIENLIMEALDEQSQGVPPHRLRVIDRIEEFQDYLINQKMVYGTVNLYVARIKSIYHKNRVDLPYIETINSKKVNRREYLEFKDVLTKEELRCALNHMSPTARARAMAMIQGGLSNEECEHLTTTQFINDTYKYHKCDDKVDALKWLAVHPIIWIVKLIRVKTGKPYYAILGGEAINSIASAKLHEMTLGKYNGEIPEKLFASAKTTFNESCRRVNDNCNLGYAGAVHYEENTGDDGAITIRRALFRNFRMISDVDYQIVKDDEIVSVITKPNILVKYEIGGEARFRPHNLRRFHATYIGGSALSYEEHSLISNAEIDEMQGRGKTSVQDTYIKTNPLRQKVLYAKVMNNVSLYNEYDYQIIDDDVVIWVRDQLSENKKLKNENKILKKQLQQKQQASEKVQKLREELGDDTFKELIGEILNAN